MYARSFIDGITGKVSARSEVKTRLFHQSGSLPVMQADLASIPDPRPRQNSDIASIPDPDPGQ